MNINVSEIVNSKIEEMQESGAVETAISEKVENIILKAFTDSLDSWELRRQIENKVTEQVSSVVADTDFSTYNGYIANKLKEIVEDVCRADLCEKIESTFKNIFLCERKSVKLSEFFEKYREIVCDSVDEHDKYDRQRFHVKCEEDERYGWLKCELDEEQGNKRYGDVAIRFTVYRNHDNRDVGWIGTAYLDDVNVEKTMKFGRLNDVELMVVRAVLNRIPIEIDVDHDDDIDNSYDVGY